MRQPIVLNGIEGIVSRTDLMERCILVELPSIDETERRSERILMREFSVDLPYILRGILDVLVKVLATYNEIESEKAPRLADFYEYGYYICEAIGKGRGELFRLEYKKSNEYQKNMLSKFNNCNELVEIIDGFLEYSEDYWEGTAGELCDELHSFESEWKDKDTKSSIPQSANRLMRELNTLKEPLMKKRIDMTLSMNSKNCRAITLQRIE